MVKAKRKQHTTSQVEDTMLCQRSVHEVISDLRDAKRLQQHGTTHVQRARSTGTVDVIAHHRPKQARVRATQVRGVVERARVVR